MRFEQLRYLETALRAGTFRKAALELGLAQPSLSQQILRLEEDLDVVLLRRSSAGVRPTQACDALLPRIRAALRAEEALYAEASAIGGTRKGRVKLGAVGLPTRLLLPTVVRRFRESYPGIRLEAHEGNTLEITKSVLDGDLDIGIVSSFADAKELPNSLRVDEILTGVRLDVCVPAGHRLWGSEGVTADELKDEPFVASPRGHLLRMAVERLSEDSAIDVVYHTDTSETARIMVASGIGISILARPTILSSEEAAAGRVGAVRLNEPWATAALSIIRRSNEQPVPGVKVMLDLINDEAAQLATLPEFASS